MVDWLTDMSLSFNSQALFVLVQCVLKLTYADKKQHEMLDVLQFLCCYGFFIDFSRGIHCVAFVCSHSTFVAGVVRLPAYQVMVQSPVKTHNELTVPKCTVPD